MKIYSFRKTVSSVALFVCLASVSTLGIADPYFITYTGTIDGSTFPEVTDTEAYTATLVFDNGGASAVTQTWEAADLTCAIFTANDAQDVQFFHDLTLQTSPSVSGSASTDAGGILSANFSSVVVDPVDPGSYTSAGIALVEPLDWYMNDANRVFYANSQAQGFGDAAGGVQMAAANWTDPLPYNGTCAAEPPVVEPVVEPIPFAPLWALVLMTGLLMTIGARRLKKG